MADATTSASVAADRVNRYVYSTLMAYRTSPQNLWKGMVDPKDIYKLPAGSDSPFMAIHNRKRLKISEVSADEFTNVERQALSTVPVIVSMDGAEGRVGWSQRYAGRSSFEAIQQATVDLEEHYKQTQDFFAVKAFTNLVQRTGEALNIVKNHVYAKAGANAITDLAKTDKLTVENALGFIEAAMAILYNADIPHSMKQVPASVNIGSSGVGPGYKGHFSKASAAIIRRIPGFVPAVNVGSGMMEDTPEGVTYLTGALNTRYGTLFVYTSYNAGATSHGSGNSKVDITIGSIWGERALGLIESEAVPFKTNVIMEPDHQDPFGKFRELNWQEDFAFFLNNSDAKVDIYSAV